MKKTADLHEVTIDSTHLIHELRLLRLEMKANNSWKNRLFLALVTGFGTVMGATVVVTLILYLLTQLASIEVLRPVVEQIVKIVENSRR